jgi:hypothetical protein
MNEALNWAGNNWFRLAVLLLLAVICWQLSALTALSEIEENTSEIRDGIEVQIVNEVDSLVPSVRIPNI